MTADENAATAAAMSRVAELLTRYPGLPRITYVTVSTHYRPPRVDLWVREVGHVGIWAETLGARTETETRYYDSPLPSYRTTQTPMVELGSVHVRVIHLEHLPQDRSGADHL